MTEGSRRAYKKVLIAILALMDLDPDIDSPEGILLESIAKACKHYEENMRFMNVET